MTTRAALQVLDASIDARVRETRRDRPGWPCGRGCDSCCRNLFEPMTLSGDEWRRVEEGIARLDPHVRAVIETRVQEAGRTCPFLDRDRGECLIYERRPLACRTYGYYVEQGNGLWCADVQRYVDREGLEGVVLGNQALVDRQLGSARIPMATWAAGRR